MCLGLNWVFVVFVGACFPVDCLMVLFQVGFVQMPSWKRPVADSPSCCLPVFVEAEGGEGLGTYLELLIVWG